MLSWSALVAAYTLFWFAVAALVNTVGLSSSTNALIMVALWTILVLILPVAMNLAVGLVSPAPSRTELASRTRVATAESLHEYEDLYSADYRYASDPEALLVLLRSKANHHICIWCTHDARQSPTARTHMATFIPLRSDPATSGRADPYAGSRPYTAGSGSVPGRRRSKPAGKRREATYNLRPRPQPNPG
jgi:hypothetical protein